MILFTVFEIQVNLCEKMAKLVAAEESTAYDEHVQLWFFKLALAVEHLHTCRIIHKNISPK